MRAKRSQRAGEVLIFEENRTETEEIGGFGHQRPTVLSSLEAKQLHRQHVWQGLLSLLTAGGHAIAIIATLYFAELHTYIQASPRLAADILQLDAHLLDFFDPVKVACYVATAFHAVTLLYVLQDCIWVWFYPSRRFSSSPWWATVRNLTSIQVNDPAPVKLPNHKRCWKRAYASRVKTFNTYHAEFTQLRLLIEVIMQTYQANKMSDLVATVWLNRLLVLVVVVNCWFTPLIYTLMRRQSPHVRRVVRLSVDTALDVLYSFGIPCIIIIPYLRVFIPALGSFPLAFYIMDTWTTVTGSELQQLFVFSWWDFVSKVSPWFFFTYRLHSLRRIISEDPEASGGIEENAHRTRLSRLLNSSLLLWGFGVLVAHLQTAFVANTASSLGCLVEMRPWFQTTYTCTVVELSCSQRRISGIKTESQAALSEFTPDRVRGLIVSHCPHFEMPPTILSFSTIAMLKFYNTTISDWGSDVVLTARTNPNIQQLFAIKTNFSSFPEGLLSLQMSNTIRDVKFVATNLTTLPMALTTAWNSVKYFAVDRSLNVPTFPEALVLMPDTLFVSFAYNDLRELSESTLEKATVSFLTLEGNPLRTLPEHIGNLDRMLGINMQRTRLQELPAPWQQLPRATPLVILALCEQLQGGSADPPPMFSVGKLDIVCKDTVYLDSAYPITLEESWRETNRYPVE